MSKVFKLHKYHCQECNVEVISDMGDADYCSNCGSVKIKELPMTNEDTSYIEALIQ